ncbi:MAG: cation:proton antiporter [Gemmatimonadetes bacterium]|nr:cation:proton antiporter [Gemmatimonadota bacterium]
MERFDVIVAALGGMILLLGLPSKWISRGPVPPTLLALAFGILVGPAALGWIDPAALGDSATILERAARLTLAIGLLGVALGVPREYPRRNAREMMILVGPGTVLMWAVSATLVYLILDFHFWLAVLIGAIITATDPVAASPIVTGELAKRNLPERLRHAISFESGANDGLSYLLVFLPFLMLTRTPEEALSQWLVHTLLWEVGGATLFGLALGYTAGKLLQIAGKHDAIEGAWRLIYTVALGLFAAGAGRLIGSDEVLVIFAAGAAFVQVVSASEREEEEQGQEAVDRFFSVPIFALLGTALPWEGWRALGWNGVLLAVAVLLLRRPLPLLLLRPLLPSVRSWPDTLFLGWFGPISVAAIYYAALMEHKLNEPRIWDVVSLVICASILAHATTGAPLTRLYGRVTGMNAGRGADHAIPQKAVS